MVLIGQKYNRQERRSGRERAQNGNKTREREYLRQVHDEQVI